MHFQLVGLSHRPQEAKDIVANLNASDKVYLVREPTNDYDVNAVMIESEDGTHLGYVAAALAGDGLADEMDDLPSGTRVPATVVNPHPKRPSLHIRDDEVSFMKEQLANDD